MIHLQVKRDVSNALSSITGDKKTQAFDRLNFVDWETACKPIVDEILLSLTEEEINEVAHLLYDPKVVKYHTIFNNAVIKKSKSLAMLINMITLDTKVAN